MKAKGRVHCRLYSFIPKLIFHNLHKCRWEWVKINHFGRKTRYNSKNVQDRRIVSIKVEQEVICALSNGDLG